MKEVVAALISRDGRFLICQRPPEKMLGLYWEFVGGKVEPGETREAALVRECQEELGITVGVKAPFMEVTHTYPEMTIHLTLFCAHIETGEPALLEHKDMRWVTVQEMKNFSFCPADTVILDEIARRFSAQV